MPAIPKKLKELDNKVIRKRLVKRLDSLWSQIVKTRDEMKCQFPDCRVNYSKLDPHHFFGKGSHPALRWEVDNGITLCSVHHFEVHADSYLNIEIFTEFAGEALLSELRVRKNNLFPRNVHNLELKKLELESKVSKSNTWSTAPDFRPKELK